MKSAIDQASIVSRYLKIVVMRHLIGVFGPIG